jgi:phosphonate transport system substrate-binding protein
LSNNIESGSDTGRGQTGSSSILGDARIFRLILSPVLIALACLAAYNIIKVSYPGRSHSRFFPSQWVNLDEQATSSAVLNSTNGIRTPPFRVAIAPILSPEKSLEIYQGFAAYLAGKLRRNPITLYRESYSETNNVVRYGRCDIAIVGTYPFIRGEREFGMQALVVPQIAGETSYQSIIVIPQSSQATSLTDLRGKRFASIGVMSTTGWLFPELWLRQHGEDPNHFFGEQIITGSHDESIQAVAKGYVDVAAAQTHVYDQMVAKDPTILKKTKILLKSPSYGAPPIVVHPNIDLNLKKEILSILLNMHNDDEGKRILDTLRIERFVVPAKGLFDNLRQEVARAEGWE